MKLHLGVLDVPYAHGIPRGTRRAAEPARTTTTGDVAGYLENKYHVVEIFFQLHGQNVADDLASSLRNSLESLAMGAPPTMNPFAEATNGIEQKFRDFLTNREMERLGYPGVPTQAALDGYNPRLKRRYGKRRPSFVATGLYRQNFRAWMEE